MNVGKEEVFAHFARTSFGEGREEEVAEEEEKNDCNLINANHPTQFTFVVRPPFAFDTNSRMPLLHWASTQCYNHFDLVDIVFNLKFSGN